MNSILNTYMELKERVNNLNANVESLNCENQRLREEISRITSEPYYIKVMNFRTNVKKTIIYKIYSRLRYGKIVPETYVAPPCQEQRLEFNYDYMLSNYEYIFLDYKKHRNNGFKLNLNKISVPCVKDLVSVILPVYNGDDYVNLAIESVLSQTYKNFEFIIVDDGSTDKTSQIVDEYAAKDSRIKVIHQENRKLPRTLSRGFREARGEFLTWTSADNIMHPQFLEKFVNDMKKYDHTAMIYGNIRLIDEKGNPKTDFGWYADDPENPENVLLPKCILELNTFANNFIGAAFMYRAVVANILEDYSRYKYGIEDYDYWMKVNELFTLRHASFNEIEYSYRMHSKSLTSKDKELKITENRYKQMLLDAFRRDYFLIPLYWIVDTDDADNVCYKELCNAIKKHGHYIISKTDAKKQTPNFYERFIYVRFSKDGNAAVENVPSNAYKVLIAEKSVKVQSDMFDAFICNDEVTDKDFIEAYKGWYGIPNGSDAFAFIDSKAKNTFLYDLEGDAYSCTGYEKELSIIITYCGNTKLLKECINSIPEKDNKEILIIANAAEMEELKPFVNEEVQVIFCLSQSDVTKKNVAVRMATGKFYIFIQSDCQLDMDSLNNTISLFGMDSRIAVMYGKVEANTRKKYQEYAKVLGEYEIKNDDLYEYQDWNIPSAYSYAVRAEQFKLVGGFYHLTSEHQDEFCNMEMFGLAMALKNVGRYLYLSTDFSVVRYVDESKIKEIEAYVTSEKEAFYMLQILNVLPYNVYPEGMASEMNILKNIVQNDDNNIVAKAKLQAIEKLIERVRDDFRNKEKVDVHRDMFSQPV